MLAADASLLEMLEAVAFLMWMLAALDNGFGVLSGGQAACGYQCGH
jgi:hypothetical protein